MRSSRGFTLLELIVVLALVAIVSATVVVRWSGVQQRATLEAAVKRLEFYDAHLRRYAQAHGTSSSLAFDLQKHLLRKHYQGETHNDLPWERLGRNIRIVEFKSSDGKGRGRQVELAYRRDGTSATYGIELSGPRQQEAWLVVAGLTGQVTQVASDREFQDALQILSPRQ